MRKMQSLDSCGMHGLLKGRIQVPRETKRELRLQQMLAEPNPEVSHEIAKLKECAESTKIMVEQVLSARHQHESSPEAIYS